MNEVLERFYIERREDLLRRLNYGAGTPENAEDILQEAFVRALTYWDTFDPENKELGAWFSTILKNSLRDFKRDEWLFGMGEEFDEEQYDPQEMPLPETELIKQIYEMVDGKGESQQEVLLLYFDKHYSIKDIHNITGQKYKTVEQIVVRFKKEVKEKYA
ncbi:RNA polymerase sigma factor SigX [compost metagenome]|jgi:RNA polymerase sigma factor (sigma-70 family)